MLLIIIALLCVAIMCARSSNAVTVTIDSKSTHNDMVGCELHSVATIDIAEDGNVLTLVMVSLTHLSIIILIPVV